MAPTRGAGTEQHTWGQGQGWGQGPTTKLPVLQAGGGEAQHRGDTLGRRRSHRCASGTSTALLQRVAEERGQVEAAGSGYCFPRNSAPAKTLLNVTKRLASH